MTGKRDIRLSVPRRRISVCPPAASGPGGYADGSSPALPVPSAVRRAL
jgi:hypothetical protein